MIHWTMLEIGYTGLALIALGSVSTHAWTPDIPLDQLKARWATAPSKFIELDGMQVHYRDEGPRDDPAPILLLHGTGNSLHTWTPGQSN